MKDAIELIEDEEQRYKIARAFIKQDELDSVQLLSDLKYLDDKAFEDGNISSEELRRAIRQFRIECKMANAKAGATSNFKEIWKNSAVGAEMVSGKLSQSELLLLKELVGLEGELVFGESPSQLDICCRVAFYRFSIYGLSRQRPDPARLKSQLANLEQIVAEFKYPDGLAKFLNILGAQNKLTQFCQSSRFSTEGFIGPIFFFKVKKARAFNKLTGEKIKLTKKKNFLKSVQPVKVEKTLDRLLKADSIAVEKQVNDYITKSRENRFMLRVLQVKLWVLGLYQGRLDHDFGTYSVEALKQLLDLIHQEGSDGTEDLPNILYVINSGQCMVNFQYLLKVHIFPFETKGNSLALDNYHRLLNGDYETHENGQVRAEAKRLSTEVHSSLINHADNLKVLEKPRKMYKGKSGFRKFLSSVVKFVKNAVSKIVNIIRKLIKLLSKTIKFVFEEIKEAFITFKRGLAFLFGKRKVSVNPLVISDYDFDFDGYTLLLQSATNAQLTAHKDEVQLRAEALYPTIRFVTEVIRWGSNLSTPVGWVKILTKMAEMLKNLIRGKEKE